MQFKYHLQRPSENIKMKNESKDKHRHRELVRVRRHRNERGTSSSLEDDESVINFSDIVE